MINSLKVKRKDGEIIEIKLRELKLSDINKIIKLQELIINGLENKELYADSKQEEFEEVIQALQVLGYRRYEINKILPKIKSESLEERIKEALQYLAIAQ